MKKAAKVTRAATTRENCYKITYKTNETAFTLSLNGVFFENEDPTACHRENGR